MSDNNIRILERMRGMPATEGELPQSVNASQDELIERLTELSKGEAQIWDEGKAMQEARDALKAKDAEIARLNRVIEVEALNYARQHDEIARLRAALEFYANRDNYVLEGEGSAIDADDGEIARKALEGK